MKHFGPYRKLIYILLLQLLRMYSTCGSWCSTQQSFGVAIKLDNAQNQDSDHTGHNQGSNEKAAIEYVR